MNRLVKAVAVLILLGLAVYWAGADIYGLWLPAKLPWRSYSGEYAPPTLTLPGVSQTDAATQLLSGWLEQYKSSQTDPYVRIREYRIVDLEDCEPYEGGFVCLVKFNLRPYGRLPQEVGPGTTLAELKTFWISGNGMIEDGWVKDKMLYLWIKQLGETYSVVDMGTAPPWLVHPDQFGPPDGE